MVARGNWVFLRQILVSFEFKFSRGNYQTDSSESGQHGVDTFCTLLLHLINSNQ